MGNETEKVQETAVEQEAVEVKPEEEKSPATEEKAAETSEEKAVPAEEIPSMDEFKSEIDHSFRKHGAEQSGVRHGLQLQNRVVI